MVYALIVLIQAASAAPMVRVTPKAGVVLPTLGATAVPNAGSMTLGTVPKLAVQAPLPVMQPLAATLNGINESGAANEGGAASYGAGQNIEKAMTGEVTDELAAEVAARSAVIGKIRDEVGKVIVGQKEMVDSIIMSMIAGEHVLLEGIPGVAKTQTVKAFSNAVSGDFQRIQGTPDKLPSDILGAEVMQDNVEGKKQLVLEKGPIFANILLVDEINRMMPKTQSSLLEAMQERRVTIGRESLELPKPFLLLATQNPIEQEGTYRLPEAQQDRFMFKVIVNRPSAGELKEIMARYSTQQQPKANKVATLDEVAAARETAEKVRIDESLRDYITAIVEATHEAGPGLKNVIENGASPRAGIFLEKAAKINAFLAGRSYVLPEDIRAVAHRVLRHRIMLSYAAGNMTTDQVIDKVLELVPVPQKP